MTKLLLVASGLLFSLAVVPATQAQVTLDVSKITCGQFAFHKITNPANIAIWLSGYYNAKRDNTIIDTQQLTENAARLQNYCVGNPKMPVMQAVEKLFGKSK